MSAAGLRNSPDVLLDLKSDSSTLVVAFGGLFGRLGGLGAFEFMRTLGRLEAKFAFVRDAHRLWYQRGVEGVGSSIDSVADGLRDLVALADTERVVLVGASAGGYAAILFGSLISVQRVLAFVPQTFLDPEHLEAVGDRRWPELRGRAEPQLDPRYTDLRRILEADRGSSMPSVHVHYAQEEELDAIHARHIAGMPGVHLVAHRLGVGEDGAHNLSKALRERGLLEKIVLEHVSGTEPEPLR